MKVKIKKLVEQAVIPIYAHPDEDAGLDLTAISVKFEHGCWVYGTGLAMEIPKGYVGLLFPRSSNRKTEAYLTNSVGVIDSGYRGEIMFSFKNRDRRVDEQPYKVGDRLGQIIIIPYPQVEFEEVESLEESNRGEDGHGSTGK
nr:MAG: dUTPase [Bacteriophage sp.]